MSLLIKALDQAAKNKETEHGHALKSTPLNLTLEPLTEVPLTEKPEVIEAKLIEPEAVVMDERAYEKATTNTPAQAMQTEATLAQQSLEEEAGLSLSPKKTVRSKYAKNEAPLVSTPNASAELPVAESRNANSSNKQDVPTQAPILPLVFQSMADEQQKQNQQTAAKVFVANQQSKKSNSTLGLFLLGLAGALILLLLWQGYQMLRTLFAPEPVQVSVSAPPPTTESLAGLNAELNQSQSLDAAALPANNMADPLSAGNTEAAVIGEQAAQASKADAAEAPLVKPSAIEQDMNNIRAALKNKPGSALDTEQAGNPDVALNAGDIKMNAPIRKASQAKLAGNSQPAGTVQLLKKSPADGVDPHLQAAYQAFTAGDFSLAQQQYRTVLQADIRNVDALLGMAAIAQRQNRVADANGWYQKVLEIEPRNTTAQTAMANMAVNDDAVTTQSRLKSMIAEQPNNANLHVTLGNVYAEKNQWSSAQEAYFNASKLAPDNADYAFNLAVSLEQLRKPKLAYVQYLRALDLRNANNATSPDKAVLEARIRALSAQ